MAQKFTHEVVIHHVDSPQPFVAVMPQSSGAWQQMKKAPLTLLLTNVSCDQDACHHLLLLAGAKHTRHGTFQSWPGTQPPHMQPNGKAIKLTTHPSSCVGSQGTTAAPIVAADVGATVSSASPTNPGASKQALQSTTQAPSAVPPQGGANNNKKRKEPEGSVTDLEPGLLAAQRHQRASGQPHQHYQEHQQHMQPALSDGEDVPDVERRPGAELVPVRPRVFEKGGVLEEAPPGNERPGRNACPGSGIFNGTGSHKNVQ